MAVATPAEAIASSPSSSSSSPSRPSSPELIDPRKITSQSQITTQLSLLAKKESDLTLSLNALISDRRHIDTALTSLRQIGSAVSRVTADVDGRGRGSLGFSTRGLGTQDGDDVGAGAGALQLGLTLDQDGLGNGDGLRSAIPGGGGAGTAGIGVGGSMISESLVDRVAKVWETSERVGGKVRRLDEEISRVREATEIVTEVLELKNALQTLASAMSKADWESASRACKRAMSVRKEVIEGGFAGAVVPTPAHPEPPSQQLSDLRTTLLQIFRTEFDNAAIRKDEQAVSRFFRLWPGIGAEEEGLEAYGDFVVDLVKARSSNINSGGGSGKGIQYLTGLTGLLESIAHIIDQHQPVVDKYYGVGRMRFVVGRLVLESDRVVRGLVEGWEEERRVGRLISDTKQSKFPLLTTPTLLPPLYPSLLNPSSAPQLSLGSIATATTSHLPNLSSASTLLSSYAPGAKRQQPQSQVPERSGTPVGNVLDDEPTGPDPRDVDRVLGELVALGGRWALFRKFVWGRISDDDEDDFDEDEARMNGLSLNDDDDENINLNGKVNEEDKQAAEQRAAERAKQLEQLDILDESGSQKAIENLLKVYYELLELWYLRMSIEKAQRLDSPETSSRPHLSSILDDTFYLLKLVLSRILSCGSISTLKTLRYKMVEIIERDYVGVIRKKMDMVYAVQGGGNDRERESKSRDQRSAFIIYLNDLDVSADYMERLIDETTRALPQTFIRPQLKVVKSELSQLGELSTVFRLTCKSGLEQLFNQLTRPKLRGILDDCYKDLNYLLDEDDFQEAEENDLVRKKFVRAWEGLVEGYKEGFTDHNYQAFFNLTVENLVRPWEKMVMSMRFTELGAIRYDRDVRGIANYLSTQTSFGGARDKFTRLQQIGTVLNMDADEDAEDFYSNSGIPWRLSKAEYNVILDQRQ